jgi:hypothetical protein
MTPSPTQSPSAAAVQNEVLLLDATVTTLAGRQGINAPFSDGAGTAATFDWPSGIAMRPDGVAVLVRRDTAQ